jgi:hypothetical protein
MGGCCSGPTIRSTDDVVNRYLTTPADYPRAARAFEQIGAPEFAIICWIAAGRPHIAEAVYERTKFYYLDNVLSPQIPVWRLIVGSHNNDEKILAGALNEYIRSRGEVAEWLKRALLLI